MHCLSFDTRFERFENGQRISDQGALIAGDDPYLIYNGSVLEMVMHKPEHLKDFYSGDGRDHGKPKSMNMGYFFHQLLGVSVGVQSGEKWRATRSYFDQQFSHAAATGFMKCFTSEIGSFTVALADGLKIESGESVIIDAAHAFRTLPFKLIATALYGEALDEEVLFPDLSL